MSEQDKLRSLALALLNGGVGITRRSGQFLGQIVGEPGPLSEKQFQWLAALAERGGMADQIGEITHV